MSEKAPAQEKGGKGEKKGGNMPLFAIIGTVLILNVLMVGKIFMGGNGKETVKVVHATEEVGAKMPLEEFLVNLAGSSDHYLKATIALGLKKGEGEEKLKEEIAPIRDAALSVLSTKKLEELATEEGKEKLKTEMKEKINKELGGDKVVKIYFMSFATQ